MRVCIRKGHVAKFALTFFTTVLACTCKNYTVK